MTAESDAALHPGNQPDTLIVHCSDTPDDRDIGRAEIDAWHRQPPRNWRSIGYHYVVRRDGTIESGREERMKGAHALGYNDHSLGVCWVGRDHPEAVQYEAMLGLLMRLMDKHNISSVSVYGHHEVNPGRTCPNLDCAALRAELAKRRPS